jgi:hypothetical protein
MVRKATRRAVRENEDVPDLEVGVQEFDEEAADEEAESEARSKSRVRPIHDEPDYLVFRFEVGPAILAQLLDKLNTLGSVPLNEALGARYAGFYQIFLNSEPKYIGKTARPIGVRLREHARKLLHRTGIEFDKLECKYAFVEDPSLVDVAEGALIDFFGARGLADWNASGFGSKVTGHRRGRQVASNWSVQYPPDIDAVIEPMVTGDLTISRLVRALASCSPLTLSVPRRHTAAFLLQHSEHADIDMSAKPFSEWMQVVESHLNAGWHLNKQAESWYIEPRT